MSAPATARLALAAACLVAAAQARAESTAGGCHCYQDRTFDPERPAAADPYILATTRSSLVSAAFGVPKRALVGAVMTGTPADDLLIAHWAGARSRRDAEDLLDARKARGSWMAALAGAPGLGRPFELALAKGEPDAALARLAVEDLLASRLKVEPAALAALQAAGAGTNEAILAAVLARRVGSTPASMLEPVKSGRATWGRLLQGLGLVPKDIDGLVREAVGR